MPPQRFIRRVDKAEKGDLTYIDVCTIEICSLSVDEKRQ